MGIPPISISSSTVSRVVPGISETIALSRIRSALSRELLPTFGFPTMAVAKTMLQRPAHERRAKQLLQIFPRGQQAVPQAIPVQGVDVLVGEVNRRFDLSQQTHQSRADGPEPLGKAALQLPYGRPQRAGTARRHDGRHAFGLRQIDPPVQERSLGELARLRRAGAKMHEQP